MSSLLIRKKFGSRSGGSNTRPSDPKPDALPTELLRHLLETCEILEFIYYILSNYAYVCVQKRKSRAGQGCCTVYTYIGTVSWHLNQSVIRGTWLQFSGSMYKLLIPIYYYRGVARGGGRGGPQNLANQQTIFKPGGQIMPLTLLPAPPLGFKKLSTPLY